MASEEEEEKVVKKWGLRPTSATKGPVNTVLLDDDDDDEDDPPGTSSNMLLEYRCTSFPNKGTVEVYSKDVECLNTEEFLNDTIIDFWMSYHCDNTVKSTDFRRIVVFSSLFYRSLVRHKQTEVANGCSSFPRSNWTKGISNIFRKDFIFVPIPEEDHWLLAVICYPGMVYDSQEEEDKDKDEKEDEDDEEKALNWRRLNKFISKRKDKGLSPMILIFDSFRTLQVNCTKIVRNLRSFLKDQWSLKYSTSLIFDKENLPMVKPRVPQQVNWFDCGIYTLEFFEAFFYKPILPLVSSKLVNLTDWFDEDVINKKRGVIYQTIRNCISDLHPERENLIPQLKTKDCDGKQLEMMDTDSDDNDEYVPLISKTRSPSPEPPSPAKIPPPTKSKVIVKSAPSKIKFPPKEVLVQKSSKVKTKSPSPPPSTRSESPSPTRVSPRRRLLKVKENSPSPPRRDQSPSPSPTRASSRIKSKIVKTLSPPSRKRPATSTLLPELNKALRSARVVSSTGAYVAPVFPVKYNKLRKGRVRKVFEEPSRVVLKSTLFFYPELEDSPKSRKPSSASSGYDPDRY